MEFDNHVSSTNIKENNKKRIYKLLYDHPKITKAEVSSILNISMPVVIRNMRQLYESGMIQESGILASTGGRKAVTFSINPSAMFAIGVDITKRCVNISIVDLLGTVVQSSTLNRSFSNSMRYFSAIRDQITKDLALHQIEHKQVLGIGIAVPAIVSADGMSITYSTILHFDHLTIERFEQVLGFPCRFCNDSNAGGAAELWLNPSITNAVYISLSSSVGGSFLINHELFTGKHQRCSEIGHITIVPNGRKCYCGKCGCLDAYCNSSVLANAAGGDLPAFFKGLSQNNQQIVKVWNQYIDKLILAIHNICMLFDCDIILGGKLGGYISEYIPELQKRLEKTNPFEQDATYLKSCQYKSGAASMGASLIFIRNFLRENFP